MKSRKKFVIVAPDSDFVCCLIAQLLEQIKGEDFDITVVVASGEDIRELEDLGVKVVVQPFDYENPTFFSMVRYIFTLKRLFAKIGANAVLGCTTKFAAYSSIAARMCGVVYISSFLMAVDHVPYVHRLGFSASHNIIFLSYNDRYVYQLYGLIDKNKTSVLNCQFYQNDPNIDSNRLLFNALQFNQLPAVET
ncbi:MAG: glycosyltransferase [Rikenellaceae bacterium]